MILRMTLPRILIVLLASLLFSSYVPAQTASMSKSQAAPKSSKTTAVDSGAADQIDINRANAATLKTLPGIGDAYSSAIIKNRPYKNKSQLVSRKVIPQVTYDKIKDKIVAKK